MSKKKARPLFFLEPPSRHEMPSREEAYHHTFKIALAGNSGVGKSAMVRRLVGFHFDPESDATIGVEFQVHTLWARDPEGARRRVRLQIWDTAGQEQFFSLTRNYFRNIAGAVVVYAVDDPGSRRGVERWIEEIQGSNAAPVPVVVCANKADLRQGPAEEREDLLVASALTGEGVEEAFRGIAEAILAAKKGAAAEEEEAHEGTALLDEAPRRPPSLCAPCCRLG